MNIKKYLTIALSLAVSSAAITSCTQDDEWATPPLKCENRFGEANTPMSQVAAMAPALGDGYYTIDTDVIFDGYVISSDEQSNFYKTIVFQDQPENPTVGLQISVEKANTYADFPIGSHIRINAKGLRIANDKGIIKLGSADAQYTIGRIPETLLSRYVSGVCDGNGLDIKEIVPREVSNLAEIKNDNLVNTLVTTSVQFADGEINPVQKRYVDFQGTQSSDTNRTIEDKGGNSTLLRTAKYAKFGYDLLPKGAGKMTFIVSKYQSKPWYDPEWQVYIRSLEDVKLSENESERFTKIFEDSFADLNNWQAISITGDQTWGVANFGNPSPSAKISGYNGGPQENEDWLVSNAIEVPNGTSASLSFQSVKRYNGADLEVFYTTDFTGDVTTTNWTALSPTLDTDTGSWTSWTSSGELDVSSALGGNLYIAFKYTSDTTGAATFEIDNVAVILE